MLAVGMDRESRTIQDRFRVRDNFRYAYGLPGQVRYSVPDMRSSD
jgi:hypothetical protein